MTTLTYSFVTEWHLDAAITEVADVLSGAPGFARWCPAVFLKVIELEFGDETGVGSVVDFHTSGWLPYTLRWQAEITAADYPHTFSLAVQGDLTGSGTWTLEQIEDQTRVHFVWEGVVRKAILRYMYRLLESLFVANHRWAMARGEEGIRRELIRRRIMTPEHKARIPAPPKPTWLVRLLRL